MFLGYSHDGGRAAPVLGDRSLVARADDSGATAEVELAVGASPDRLLRALVDAGVGLSRFEVAEASSRRSSWPRSGPRPRWCRPSPARRPTVHKLLAVIRREFMVRVHTRAFVVGTVLGPLLMAALFVMPMLLESRDKAPKRIVVYDAASGDFGGRVTQAMTAARRGDGPDAAPRYNITPYPAGPDNLAPLDSLVGRTGLTGARSVEGSTASCW